MRIAAISAAIVTVTTATLLVAQQPQPQPQTQPPAQSQAAPVQPLSPQAMEAIVAGIAFYPDAVIEQILDAAQYPDAIKHAVAGTATNKEELAWPSSVQLLTTHREVLRQLDQNAVITARLALAARTQLADVWAAIDRVRQQFESQSQDVTTDPATGDAMSAASSVAYPTGAFLAGYWTAQVVDEIHVWYAATAPVAVVYGQGNAVVTGPNGNSATINAAGGAAQVQIGDTTYFGAAGQGTVTTPNGTVVTGQGQMTGTITTPQSQQSMTLGDGQVGASSGENAQRTSRSATSTRMARPRSLSVGDSPYSHPSLEQWQTGRRTLANSWNQLSQGTASFQGTNALGANRAVNRSVVKPQFARPTTPGPGNAGAHDALRTHSVQPPSRNFNAPGSLAPSGGRRGRR